MQLSIGMADSEDEGGVSPIAGNANHDAVDRALPLHFHPLALPRRIPTVAALRDDAFQPGHQREPFFGLLDRRSLDNNLEVRLSRIEQRLAAASAVAERLIDELDASVLHEVKGEQYRG